MFLVFVFLNVVSCWYASFIQKDHFVLFCSLLEGFGLVKLDVKTKSCSGVVSVSYLISSDEPLYNFSTHKIVITERCLHILS